MPAVKVVDFNGQDAGEMELSNVVFDAPLHVPAMHQVVVGEISKILSSEIADEVIIYFSNKHIVFEFSNTTVNSRLIDGEFYNVDQMISSDYETKININRRELLENMDSAQ